MKSFYVVAYRDAYSLHPNVWHTAASQDNDDMKSLNERLNNFIVKYPALQFKLVYRTVVTKETVLDL